MTDAVSPRILLIDDDPLVIQLVRRVLQANGFSVVPVSEAPQGLELALKDPPDLIILDVMMPIINGFNVCRLLKGQEGCRRVPVLLLSSRSADEDRRIGEEVGADAYLGKPFNTGELLTTVRRLLSVRGDA